MDEEILTALEQAYLNGWMQASSISARSNPYSGDNTLYAEYNRGYTDALCDERGMD